MIGAVGIGQIGRTFVTTKEHTGKAYAHIAAAEEAYSAVRKGHSGANEDEATAEKLDPGAVIRKQLEAVSAVQHTSASEPAEGHGSSNSGGHH